MNCKIEDQNHRMDRIIEWVKVCDSKTSILMSVVLLVPTFIIGTDWVLSKLGHIISIIIEAINSRGEGYCFSIPNFLVLVLLILTLSFTIVSCCFFLLVLKAKTKESTYGKLVKANSLVHFNNIASMTDFDTYKRLTEEETEDDYYEELLSQTYINAKCCAEKFALYNKGLCWLVFAMICLVLFILMLFFVQI